MRRDGYTVLDLETRCTKFARYGTMTIDSAEHQQSSEGISNLNFYCITREGAFALTTGVQIIKPVPSNRAFRAATATVLLLYASLYALYKDMNRALHTLTVDETHNGDKKILTSLPI